MIKRVAALALLAALTLTGCAGTPNEAPSEAEKPAASATQAESPEPLAVTPEPSSPHSAPETAYLDRVRQGLEGTQLAEATDEQLLAAAADACVMLAKGIDEMDISVVENDERGESGWYKHSAPIVVFGGINLCPDDYPDDAIHP